MTSISPEVVRKVVAEVVREVVTRNGTPAGDGIFPDMDSAIAAADTAWRSYLDCSMKDRARFVQAIRDVVVVPEHLEYLARSAVE